MHQANYIRIDFKDNPDLKDVFKDKGTGDKCTLTVTFQIDSVTGEAATGSIEKVASEEYETKDGEDISPDGAKPIMVVMLAAKAKGKSEAAKEYAEST